MRDDELDKLNCALRGDFEEPVVEWLKRYCEDDDVSLIEVVPKFARVLSGLGMELKIVRKT